MLVLIKTIISYFQKNNKMASKIDFKNPELSIYYHNIALVDFKNWISDNWKLAKQGIKI